MQTFAAQAVIAIENARLLNELRQRTDDLTESLEQQTATSEVLKVISSSPGELEPVFQAMLSNATRVCSATYGTMYLCEADGFRTVALHNSPAAYAEVRRREGLVRPPPDSPLGSVALTKKVAHITDLRAVQSYIDRHPFMVAAVDLGGYRTAVCVPMLKDNELVGAITISRTELRPFTDKQIELVQNFAAQAVIAIENTRLLNELRQRTDDLTESLEQQTATSEVLKVISSSPGELEPVFEAMLRTRSGCAKQSSALLYLYDGEAFRHVALHDVPPAYAAFREDTIRPSAAWRHARSGRHETKQLVHVADVHAVPPYIGRQSERAALGRPRRRAADGCGADAQGKRTDWGHRHLSPGGPPVHRQADRAGAELRRAGGDRDREHAAAQRAAPAHRRSAESLEQQTATAEVLKVISRSTFDLQPVLDTLAESAARLCEADMASYSCEDGELIGSRRATASRRVQRMHGKQSDRAWRWTLVGRRREREPVLLPDAWPIRNTAGRSDQARNFRTMLGVPLLREGTPIGVIAVMPQWSRPFTDKQIELRLTFADQAVIAIENVAAVRRGAARTDDLTESLQQQTATADVLKVISRSPFDLQTGARRDRSKSAARLCDAEYAQPSRSSKDELLLSSARHRSPEAARSNTSSATPLDAIDRSSRDRPRRCSKAKRASMCRTCRPIPSSNCPRSAEARRLAHHARRPDARESESDRRASLFRQEVPPFTDKQIELVQNFAAQAVIAIENTRLLDEVQSATTCANRCSSRPPPPTCSR